MKRAWKPLLVAFALGLLVGVAGAWWSAPYYFHRRWESGKFQNQLLQRFSSKLKLTPDQRTQVAAILEAKRQHIEMLRAEVRPKFEDIRSTTSAEIHKLLTAEQQKQFDVMQAEWETRSKKWHPRPSG